MYTTENQSLNLRYTYKKIIIIVAAVFDRRDNVRDGKIPKATIKIEQILSCNNPFRNYIIIGIVNEFKVHEFSICKLS